MAADAANDAEYLKGTVGEPLKMALTAMVVAQPVDAIEFIGSWLLAHVEQEEGKAEVAVVEKEAKAKADAAAAAAEAKARGPTDAEVELEQQLDTEADVEALYPQLLKAVKRACGATASYVGSRTATAEGATVIGFSAASEGCDMAGKYFVGPAADAGEEGAAAEGSGVTLGLFKQREEYEAELAAAEEKIAEAQAKFDEARDAAAAVAGDDAAAAAEEEEGAALAVAVPTDGGVAAKALEECAEALAACEEAKKAVLQFPSRVLVENVARDPAVKFFGVPGLGAYLAFPVRYETALHADGVGDLRPVPEEEGPPAADDDEAAGDEAKEDKEKAAPTTTTTKTAEEEEEEAAVAKLAAANREPLNLPAFVKRELVLSVHTMGQSVVVSEAQVAACEAWASKLAAAHARADAAAWKASAMLREDAAAQARAVEDAAAELAEAEEAKVAEILAKLDEQDPAPSDADRAVAEKVARHAAALAVLKATASLLVDAVAQDAIAPPAPVAAVLRTALGLAAGTAFADTAGLGTPTVPAWPKLKRALTKSLLPFLAADAPPVDLAAAFAAEAAGVGKLPVPMDALKAALEDVDENALATFYAAPAMIRLLKWCQAAFALYDDAMAKVQADAEAAANAANADD